LLGSAIASCLITKIMDKILRLKGADRSWPANGSAVTTRGFDAVQ